MPVPSAKRWRVRSEKIGVAIFQLTDISLCDAGFLRQLLLRKAGRLARIDHDLDDETSPSRASAPTRS